MSAPLFLAAALLSIGIAWLIATVHDALERRAAKSMGEALSTTSGYVGGFGDVIYRGGQR